MGAARDVAGPADDLGPPAMDPVLGESKCWPPGFRFHPTDEELVLYYLKRKVCGRRIKLPMIGDVYVYKWEPWELPAKSLLKSGDKQWYFFSPRDRKYPNGSRANRTTNCGYWKTTGKDRTISQNSKAMGNKKTLVYYHGRAPKGERTDWVMHEYTLDEQVLSCYNNVQDCYALYKVFRKSGPGPKNGEEYGAPFREEEWDDEVMDESFRSRDNTESQVNHQSPAVPVTEPVQDVNSSGRIDDGGNTLPMNDLEDLLLNLTDEQDAIGQYSEFAAYAAEIDVETELGNLNSCLPLTEASSFEDSVILSELSTLEDNFLAPEQISYAHPVESHEMPSLTCNPDPSLLQTDEEFVEIKDLIDPESFILGEESLCNRAPVDGPDGLYGYDVYFDAQTVFEDYYGTLPVAAHNSYLDDFGDDGILNQPCLTSTELWNHDHGVAVSNTNANQMFIEASTSDGAYASPSSNTNEVFSALPTSGVAYASASASQNIEMTQGQNAHVGYDSGSWITSALSTWLDSVPSSPALASENAFINRALERVSSFRGAQIGLCGPSTVTDGQSSTSRRRQFHNSSFLLISLLVGLSAVFWLLIAGASVKLFKVFFSKFSSS